MRPEPAPYRIARMSRDDLARTLDWAAAEGWNPGRHDLDAFHAADPGGYFMGWRGTQPVAAISAVRYGDGFGFVGLYIVAPECRGQGLGWALWQHTMASLRGRVAGLDGVVEQQANYRKSGFVLAHRNVRHAGRARPQAEPVACVDLRTLDFDRVQAFDALHAPAPRTAFLRAWLAQPDSHSLGIVEDGELVASGTIRACREGHKIGPLNAGTEAAADALFRALCARVPAGDAVYLDLPEPNAAARALAARHDLQPVFETARMYAGGALALPLQRIYGITSFELG